MEKLGLGTKSTRHSIIERLYTVKYVQNDPIEPSQLGIAVIDALDKFAPHITSSAMTANLEEEMSQIAAGDSKKVQVVRHSRDLLAQELENLLPHQEEVRDALADAVAPTRMWVPVRSAARICSCVLPRRRARCSSVVRMAGLRCHLSAAERQDRGTRREVSYLRYAADQGDRVPLETARALHRS